MITSLKQEYCDSGPSLICCVREQKNNLQNLWIWFLFLCPNKLLFSNMARVLNPHPHWFPHIAEHLLDFIFMSWWFESLGSLVSPRFNGSTWGTKCSPHKFQCSTHFSHPFLPWIPTMDNPRIANPMRLWPVERLKSIKPTGHCSKRMLQLPQSHSPQFGMLSVKYPLILRTHPYKG